MPHRQPHFTPEARLAQKILWDLLRGAGTFMLFFLTFGGLFLRPQPIQNQEPMVPLQQPRLNPRHQRHNDTPRTPVVHYYEKRRKDQQHKHLHIRHDHQSRGRSYKRKSCSK